MSSIGAINLSKNVVFALASNTTSVEQVVFTPVGYSQPGVAKWADKSGGIPSLWPSLTLSVRLPSSGSRVCRVVTKLVLPTEDAVVPGQKAYDTLFQAEMVLNDRSTVAERNLLRSYVLSAFASALFASDLDPTVSTDSPLPAAIENFEVPY
jgi:hypothetical protein